MNEATARIRINALLAKAGWRFFTDAEGPPNVRLEQSVTLKPADLDALGNDFERTERGMANFLLLDDRGFPCPQVPRFLLPVPRLREKPVRRQAAAWLNLRAGGTCRQRRPSRSCATPR